MGYGHSYPWQVATGRHALELSCRLGENRVYDAELLEKELRQILARYEPVAQGSIYDGGGWTGISLVSAGGDPLELRPLAGTYEKTPALRLAPYAEDILDSFDCEMTRVRIMGLAPGQRIFWHFDADETVDDGTKARIHVPIATNPAVRFQLSHQDLFWGPGELWYGDFSFPHRLVNGGAEARFHLIMDVRITDFVRGLFPDGFLEQKPRRLAVKPFCQRSCEFLTMSLVRKVPRKIRQGEFLASSRRLVARRLQRRRAAAAARRQAAGR
jgi:hypothetical protein